MRKDFPKPVKVGDHVSEMNGKMLGEVISVAGRYVEIRLFDKKGNTARLQNNILVTSRLCRDFFRWYSYDPKDWKDGECTADIHPYMSDGYGS